MKHLANFGVWGRVEDVIQQSFIEHLSNVNHQATCWNKCEVSSTWAAPYLLRTRRMWVGAGRSGLQCVFTYSEMDLRILAMAVPGVVRHSGFFTLASSSGCAATYMWIWHQDCCFQIMLALDFGMIFFLVSLNLNLFMWPTTWFWEWPSC